MHTTLRWTLLILTSPIPLVALKLKGRIWPRKWNLLQYTLYKQPTNRHRFSRVAYK